MSELYDDMRGGLRDMQTMEGLREEASLLRQELRDAKALERVHLAALRRVSEGLGHPYKGLGKSCIDLADLAYLRLTQQEIYKTKTGRPLTKAEMLRCTFRNWLAGRPGNYGIPPDDTARGERMEKMEDFRKVLVYTILLLTVVYVCGGVYTSLRITKPSPIRATLDTSCPSIR